MSADALRAVSEQYARAVLVAAWWRDLYIADECPDAEQLAAIDSQCRAEVDESMRGQRVTQ